MGSVGNRPVLVALMLGNLVIGTGVLVPAGVLDLIAASFSVSIARAGSLMWAGAVVLGFGAPLCAWWLARVDRRALLAGSLLVYVVGYLASLVVTGFDALLVIRILTVIASAVFTPQAAVVVGLLVAPRQRAAAVTFVFLGWSLSAAFGLPLASFVGASFGWQATYAGMAALAAAQALVLWRLIPGGLRSPPVSVATWSAVARSRPLLVMLTVTALTMSAIFTVFTYLAPEIRRMVGASPATLALLLAVYGLAGVASNLLASRVVGQIGPDTALRASLLATALGMLLWAQANGSVVLVAASLLCLGGGFASNSLQQARLAAAAPALAPATIALNTTSLYVGQGIGGLLGASLLSAGLPHWLGWIGLAFALLALGLASLGPARVAGGTS